MPEKPAPSWKPTDRDLARLIRRAERELAADPAAPELAERVRRRHDPDHEHRSRSDRSAILGALAGLLLLLISLIGTAIAHYR
ncbi:hypothetical protein [Streptomyces sp. AM6-12]|uniref:hypothetical protein n=1 Tax=Streptomyces sp. AM6-12 TaxID=3345149 RepID=UPI0037BE0810